MTEQEAAELRARIGSPIRPRLAAALIPWAALIAEISTSAGNQVLQWAFAFLAVACGVYMVRTYYSRLAKRLALPRTFAFRHPRKHQLLLAWFYVVPESGAPFREKLVALGFFSGAASLAMYLTLDLIL